LAGANAAVVGVLLAALIDPVARTGLANSWHVWLAVAAFAALQFLKAPTWLVVAACALLGIFIP
jgi:chromate transporter